MEIFINKNKQHDDLRVDGPRLPFYVLLYARYYFWIKFKHFSDFSAKNIVCTTIYIYIYICALTYNPREVPTPLECTTCVTIVCKVTDQKTCVVSFTHEQQKYAQVHIFDFSFTRTSHALVGSSSYTYNLFTNRSVVIRRRIAGTHRHAVYFVRKLYPAVYTRSITTMKPTEITYDP